MRDSWIFECTSELEVIRKKIKIEGNLRGYKASLARSAACQPAYFSQVLSGRAQLTPEHAAGLADYWVLNELESEYFMTLVELGRAGTQNLIKKLELRLARLKRQNDELAQRLQPETDNPERAINYYLDWSVSAVHICLTVPGFDEVKVIARKLAIDETRVLKALSILEDQGIATRSKSRWILTSKHLHASQQTLFASLHHRNWRDKVGQLIPIDSSHKNLHYTGVVSLALADFEQVRTIVKEMISKAEALVKRSSEETLACMTIDWFEV